MPTVFALGEQKDFVSCAGIFQKQPVRTLRITLVASLAGWLAGFVVGSVGGFVMAWARYGPGMMRRVLTVEGALLSEIFWGFAVAVAILPGSLFLAAPLVFRALERSFWHPFKAACIGGVLGLAGAVLWFMFLSFFTTPVNWSQPGEGLLVVTLFLPTAVAIGATIGCAAVLVGRTYAGTAPMPTAGHEQPPPIPYEY